MMKLITDDPNKVDIKPEEFYTLTQEDKEFLEKALRTGAPLQFMDMFMWMVVAREMKCSLEESNVALQESFKTYMSIFQKVASGIIKVSGMDGLKGKLL